MIIRYTEPDLEAFSLDEGDIAVPAEIYIFADGRESEIEVYSVFKKEAELFAENYASNQADKTAEAFWLEKLNEQMNAHGFELSPDGVQSIYEYILRSKDALNAEVIQANSRVVSSDEVIEEERVELLHGPSDTESDMRCAVHEENGKIVACAAENDMFYDDDSVEIHVECAPAYRNRGYAASCTALLAEELLCDGHAVRYNCRESNLASRRVAEKAGFTHVGIRMSFVYYRQELL